MIGDMNQFIPSESFEARRLVTWLSGLEAQGVLTYAHVPNERSDRREYGSLLQEGLRPGFPDYVIVDSQRVLFLELKRQRGGTTSKEQRKWLQRLESFGHTAIVAQGFDEAKESIACWLNKENLKMATKKTTSKKTATKVKKAAKKATPKKATKKR